MKLLVLDNEGAQSLNDNAQETLVAVAALYPLWDKVMPEIIIVPSEKEEEMALGEIIGVRFFQRTSNIDDIWGDFGKVADIDPTYSSGHTLKVILPFLKAMGANSQWMKDFALQSLRLMPNINQVLASLSKKYNVWMISTSYEFFIQAFCQVVGFDFAKADCTFVERFDEIPITGEEQQMLLAFMKEVATMPLIEYDEKTGRVKLEHRDYYFRFTDFVWKTVYNMPVGELLRVVHPVGQAQKREAVERKIQELQIPPEEVMGVGDSQTDVQWVELLEEKGLSMMFNGKGRVFSKSDIAYIGEDARAIEEVADRFAKQGRQGVIDHYAFPRKAKRGGMLATITPENAKNLEVMSVKKRKEFRGVHIGELT